MKNRKSKVKHVKKFRRRKGLCSHCGKSITSTDKPGVYKDFNDRSRCPTGLSHFLTKKV